MFLLLILLSPLGARAHYISFEDLGPIPLALS